ncbi:glycosyltransferase family 2 protein [Amycolatopsis minnesotensis]|uniref:Glycosyltransferase 2-like domain-containing protein n=1 Tax=Amycolatopsis minnesotensis TaxID=337894 RepID=A0ABP5CBE7_9PSEU
MTASIVIPAYDVRPAYLAEAVESCLAQTFRGELELVVVDDGSGARSHRAYREIVRKARRAVPVRLVRVRGNRGLATARNVGIGAATGEVVVLLDADDLLAPRCVELAHAALDRSGLDLVYTDHEKRSADLSEVRHVRRKALFQRLLEQYAGTPSDPMLHATFLIHCHAFRRDALPASPFDPSYLVGDEVKLHATLSRDRPLRIGHLPEVLYHYRDNPDGICHSSLYPRLIRSIETILAAEMAHRLGEPVRTGRIGRCARTHAALYRHTTESGAVVEAPYLDYATQSIMDTSGLATPDFEFSPERP